MSKRILILVGIPDFDYGNKQSAVRTFLNTVKSAVEEKGFIAEFAEKPKSQDAAGVNQPSGGLKSTLKSLLKKWPWLYQSIAYRSYFKRQNLITEKLKQGKPYDGIIEFHTVGSTVGKELAAYWNCGFSVIFDSPVDEQFFEMHGTKTMHWQHIVDSEKQTMEAADRIMAYSGACAEYLKNKYKVKGEIAVLPCVVNKPKIENRPEEKTFNIVFIGSFLSWHKVDVLVNAFKRFSEGNKDARLQLVGYGVEWDRIKAQVENLNLTATVEMPGFVSEDELLRYKKEASIAIMPGSNWYGSPLKLFEYAQCQIPFIAPSTKTVLDIFTADEHCLFIDPQEEENSLHKNLTFLHENPLKGRDMALRANEYVLENYDSQVYAEKLVNVLLIQD